LFGYDGRELRQVLAATGLPADSALSLILDDAGWLWFGSGRRVVRADTANLWRAAGGTEELSVHWFSESDGLRALDFPAGTQPTVTKDRHGRLWFALVRGAAMVDPSTLEFRDRPPPVRVESVRYVPRGARQPVEVSLDGLQGDPVLPAGIRQVQFGFTALDFAAPERHRFRVRLVGDGAPWQDVGHDREVAFFEFPPGRHELWVQAAGSDGVWNREGARLAFVVEPFFWQTVGFRVALGMGLAGLAAVAFRGANARRERQLRTQEALRRLATELTAALEPESMARRVAACCRDLFACDGFAVVLVDRLGKIRFAAWARADGEVIPVAVRGDAVAGPLPPSLVPVLGGQSLLIRRREPVLGLPTQPPWAPETADLTVASWMAVPIHWEGAVVGLVSVQSRPRRRYGGDDLDQLQMLAAHCGAAIARMEAEQTRRENEQRLRLAMEVAGIGSWEVDLGRGRLEASPEADAVYGRPVGELSGPVENLWRLAPDSEAVAIQLAFENIVTGQAMALDRVHRVVSPGGAGADRWVEVKAFVCGEGGSRRLIGITADITRRRLMELEREGWEEQVRQSQKLEAIGTLAGGIAHDFNNILMAILGNVEMSKTELSEGHPVREGLDEIQRSGLRARDLVQRILAFSRPQEQRFEVVELPGLVAEVVKLMRPTLPAGVEIAVIEEREVPPVLADASQLHQVLVNLGTNAWHACAGRSGRIEIRLSRVEIDGEGGRRAGGLPAGIYARMEVADNGKGISAEVLPRIFDPFFTTKGPGQGTGLGLSVVHAVVKSHGGAVTVQSEPGRGACFAVFLPTTVALRPKPESPASPALSPRPVEGACVLYVDDEKSLVRLAERCLGREGYRVVTREGAAEALETYRSEPGRFDVVVTDLAMPGMSGLELSREILRLRPEARIILASGNLDPADVEEAGRMGIFSVLQKPFVARELLSALAQALAPGSSDGRKQG
jgi:signal transduction histidine kinase/CheY-like chemotaxis protein